MKQILQIKKKAKKHCLTRGSNCRSSDQNHDPLTVCATEAKMIYHRTFMYLTLIFHNAGTSFEYQSHFDYTKTAISVCFSENQMNIPIYYKFKQQTWYLNNIDSTFRMMNK